MHSRIGTFDVPPDRLDEVVEVFRGPAFDAFSACEGFLGYQSFVDRQRGRMVGLSLWSRLEDLQASSPAALDARTRAAALGAVTVGDPQIVELAFEKFTPPCLHFLCGKAGAGKSTIAERIAQQHGAVLISEDVWLARLFGPEMKTFEDYKAFAQRLKTVVGPHVIELLREGRHVVLDFPANTKASRAWFRSLFEEAGASHVLHYVDVPDEMCLARIGKRNVERPEGSHHLTEQDFAHISSFFEAPDPSETFRIEMHKPGDGAAQ